MTKEKSKIVKIITCISLVIISILFTLLVKFVDVKNIGSSNTPVGFSTLNNFIFETIGVNIIWYHITDYLGLLPIPMALAYLVIGVIQSIKRKSLFKVDKEIIILGIFYILTVAIYIFFEKVIVNFRPVLLDGILEASYPSSHTFITICLCTSSIMINKKLFNSKLTKILNIFLVVIMTFIIVGRLISGVHWFTDILGGIIISATLLAIFYSIISSLPRINNNEIKQTKQE
jgi:undecaprenyl-diphosphatase